MNGSHKRGVPALAFFIFLCLSLGSCPFLPTLNSAQAQVGWCSVDYLWAPPWVQLGQNFHICFQLAEVHGYPETFEQVAVAILSSDGQTLFDFATYDDLYVYAYGYFGDCPFNDLYSSRSPGTYQVVVRGKHYGGNWFNFDAVSGANKFVSFTAGTGNLLINNWYMLRSNRGPNTLGRGTGDFFQIGVDVHPPNGSGATAWCAADPSVSLNLTRVGGWDYYEFGAAKKYSSYKDYLGSWYIQATNGGDLSPILPTHSIEGSSRTPLVTNVNYQADETTPTFSWQVPSGANVSYASIQLFDPDTSKSTWTSNTFPTSQQSYTFPPGILQLNKAYTARIVISDRTTSSRSETYYDFRPLPYTSNSAAWNFGLSSNSGYSAEPVNTALGNYTYSHNDLKMPGSLGIDFTKSYNSQDSYLGPLGYHWTHTYNISVTILGSGNAVVKYADGHVERYAPNGNGTYTPLTPRTYNILVENADSTFTLTDKAQKQYWFASNGSLSAITDRNGNTVTLNYTGGNPTSVTDPSGRSISLVYDGVGRITQITDPLGRSLSYSYDANSNLVSYTDARGGVWSYQYDSSHQLTSITNPLGNVLVANTYLNNKVVTQANGLGNVTTFQYDTPNPGETTITDPMGRNTIHTHDLNYQLIRVFNPLGQTTSYTYDANGNRTQMTDVRGNVTQYTYDAMGNVTSKTDALGDVTSISYDALNDPLSRVDALGNKTAFAYDAKGNLITVTDALGNVTAFSYTPSGKISSITNANGNSSAFSYDSAGNLLTAKDPLNNSTTYTYDAAGRKLSVTDANGLKTVYVYDANDNLISVTDPKGKTASFIYDANNNQVSATDKNGIATAYIYDALDQVIKVSSPDTGTNLYTYNPDQTVNTKTDANEIITTYGYDGGGRLTAVAFPDASQNVAFSYDAGASQTGFLTGMIDPSGVTTYQYDALGRLVNKTETVLGIGYTTGYQYDKTANLTSMTYPSGRQVKYAVNPINLPVAVNEIMSNATVSLASAITYDKVGSLLSLTFGNSLVLQRAYDATNRLSQMAVPGVLKLNYTRDSIGNIMGIADQMKKAYSEAFGYDSLYQLQTAQGPWGNQAFTYDPNGNRLTETSNQKISSYSYQGNQLLSLSDGYTEAFQYDSNGNITWDRNLNFVYNQSNRLSQVAKDGTLAAEYIYNGKGQRVIKKLLDDQDSTEVQYVIFHYDPSGRLIEETNNQGQLISDYIYIGQSPLAMVNPRGQQEDIYFYHNDHLGAPKAMTDKKQKIVWAGGFDAFGNTVQGWNGDGSNSVKNNLRFPGQYFDKETGLSYNYFRYYNPATGRYIQPDPIGLFGGMNRYGYVSNNPVTIIDSLGLSGWLTIYSYGNGGMSGHSWISFQSDSDGSIHTYGTWLNQGVIQLHEDLEKNMNYPYQAARYAHIDDTQEAVLYAYIDFFSDLGPFAWNPAYPCSAFAAGAWDFATGELLMDRADYIVSNPTTLKQSIINANGGNAIGYKK